MEGISAKDVQEMMDTIRRVEQEDRERLKARVRNVLVDLTDYLLAIAAFNDNTGQEWAYRFQELAQQRQNELCDSIVELLMPETKKEDD